jgi:tetratricopeptide (TPR) repeat protein
MGSEYQLHRMWPQALDNYSRSLLLLKGLHDRRGQRFVLNGLGEVSDLAGRLTEALNYYQEAATLARADGEPGAEARTLEKMAPIYTRMGRNELALQCGKRASMLRHVRSSPPTSKGGIGARAA